MTTASTVYTAMGIPVWDADSRVEVLTVVGEHLDGAVKLGDGQEVCVWSGRAGAQLDITRSDDAVLCVNGQYAGTEPHMVRIQELVPDDTCSRCAQLKVYILNDRGQALNEVLVSPAGVAWRAPDLATATGQAVEANLTLAIETCYLHFDNFTQAADAGLDDCPPGSVWALTDDNEQLRATVEFICAVEAVEQRQDPLFELPYWHLRIRADGITWTAIVDPVVIPNIQPGNVLAGSGRILARLAHVKIPRNPTDDVD